MFLEDGTVLEVTCNKTGGNQNIESLRYMVNDQQPVTNVTVTTFTIDTSLLNRQTNIIRITIT
ncbi:hypothetical protein GBAR_LOCUS14119, partial [Geodia barretti]